MKKTDGRKKEKTSNAEKSFLNFLNAGNDDDTLWKDWQDAMRETASPDEPVSPEIVAFVERHTGTAAAKSRKPLVIGIAAAAAVLTGIGICLLQSTKPNTVNGYAAKTIVNYNGHQMTEVYNNSGKDKRFSLPDHSVVVLHPGSFIKYNKQQFSGAFLFKRDICLIGSALFKVAKNPLKPFTVYSGYLSTTALGTEFDILKNNGNTTVKLYHGKVVVRALNGQKGWARDVYLEQGEMVTLNNSAPQKIRQEAQGRIAVPNKTDPAAQSKKTTGQASMPLTCNDMPLSEVLETLEKYYHTNIRYTPGLINDKYFSGAILKERSPDVILRIICNMQNLHLDKTGSGYIIHQ